MKTLGILLLSLLIISEVKADYSIDPFINYLQEKGYYDIIVQIKNFYGDDIAISFCKEFIKSDDCNPLVKIYIQNSSEAKAGQGIIEIEPSESSESSEPSESSKSSEPLEKLEFLIFNPDNYNFYKGNELAIHNWIEDIKKQYNITY